ncbi:MAG: hypothetical protein ABWY20_08110 [Mycobacterium sp.]
MGKHARALLAALDTAWNVDEVRHAAAEVFQTHPDYASSPTSGACGFHRRPRARRDRR